MLPTVGRQMYNEIGQRILRVRRNPNPGRIGFSVLS
jgi:hypothetical protein